MVSSLLILVLLTRVTPVSLGAPQQNQADRFWHNGIGHSMWELAFDEPDRRLVLQLWESIGDELKTERNPLAGTYVKGGYQSGYFLRWSTRRFVVIPYFDQNLITDFGYGKVDFVDAAKITFTPERDLKGGRGLAKIPGEWAAVWNYLVPVGQLKQFGEFHAGLGEYNEFNGHCCEFVPEFLCKKLDGAGANYPAPDKYGHLLQPPIEGPVIRVGKKRKVRNWGYRGKLYSHWMERAVLIPVTVDLKGDRRVRRNMLFSIPGEGETAQYLQIIRVGPRHSVAYVVREVFEGRETYRDSADGPDKPMPPIVIGTRVTTRPLSATRPGDSPAGRELTSP